MRHRTLSRLLSGSAITLGTAWPYWWEYSILPALGWGYVEIEPILARTVNLASAWIRFCRVRTIMGWTFYPAGSRMRFCRGRTVMVGTVDAAAVGWGSVNSESYWLETTTPSAVDIWAGFTVLENYSNKPYTSHAQHTDHWVVPNNVWHTQRTNMRKKPNVGCKALQYA